MFHCLLNGVCVFIGVCFLFVWQCTTLLEADCVVEDSNLIEDEQQDTFEQGKWILPLHTLFVPNQCI
jgi:hypothetical protein